MKHEKCPHCGSKKGLELIDVCVTGTATLTFNYAGEHETVYNAELEVDDYYIDEFLYCVDCGREVCTYEELCEVTK